MDQPGLHGRHRNKDGEISRKYGKTLIRTLKRAYGAGFAQGATDDERPGERARQARRGLVEPVGARPGGRAQGLAATSVVTETIAKAIGRASAAQ